MGLHKVIVKDDNDFIQTTWTMWRHVQETFSHLCAKYMSRHCMWTSISWYKKAPENDKKGNK